MRVSLVCFAVVCICYGQSIPEPTVRLEEPQQRLEEARVPQYEVQQQPDNSYVNKDAGNVQLDNSYMDKDAGNVQMDHTKDDMQTDEYRFWGYRRPYYGRRWGGGWGGYRGWGWGFGGYGGWGGYGYARRYPAYYGYY